ncbi:MAG: alpha/beta hydrolase [Deltaproteobacteria bacterium]|nr:alpha/beta hydrolase [Deltaproteobacteria bacterium]
MGTVVQILLGIVGVGLVAFVAAFGTGWVLRRRGQLPFDAAALAADGGQYVVNADGRKIEYFVYGSTAPRAPVVVNIHGSGPEAGSERDLWAPVCDELGVRGIAVSLPGYGYTDMNPGRVVKNWPQEDLEPVLDQERVGQFMITGHSQGNPHAMAAALWFPQRCIGLGLNAPLLPSDVTKEVGVKGALGMGSLLRTEQLQRPYMAWYFAVYHWGAVTFAPWLPLMAVPATRKDARLREVFRRTLVRAVARGSHGGAWESTEDVCYEWELDPREIQTKNVCVWHAADDKSCPPEIGKWLADMFRANDGVRVDYRADDLGFGHLTYCRGQFLQPEHSMIKSLLDGVGHPAADAASSAVSSANDDGQQTPREPGT